MALLFTEPFSTIFYYIANIRSCSSSGLLGPFISLPELIMVGSSSAVSLKGSLVVANEVATERFLIPFLFSGVEYERGKIRMLFVVHRIKSYAG